MINYVSQHLLSNIPKFVSLFLGDSYTNVTGEYYKRSPIMCAHQVETPTLNICGAWIEVPRRKRRCSSIMRCSKTKLNPRC